MIQPIHFQAKWEPENLHLKAVEPTRAERIKKAVYNFFSILIFPIAIARAIGWAIGQLAKKLVLPSAWFYSHQIIRLTQNAFNTFCFGEINPLNQRFREHFSPEKYEVKTPDGAVLDTTFFRHGQAGPDTPVILLMPSNSALSQQVVYAWLIEKAMTQGNICHFLTFDYRGVSNSQGDAKHIDDLQIDADSIYQLIRDRLLIAPQRIHVYGWSLGGALSAKLKERRSEIQAPYINERSFSSIREVIQQSIPCLLKPILFWIPWCIQNQGWNLSVDPTKIQGPILVIRQAQDEVIPPAASFMKAAQKANRAFTSIELIPEPSLREDAKKRYVNHHFEPLSHYFVKGQSALRADDAAANFILPPPAEPAAGVA